MVLDVVVDTTGRVEPGSFRVVSTAHPAFVAAAQQALAATLFRPGRTLGRARVRVPIEFRLGGRYRQAPSDCHHIVIFAPLAG